MITKLDFFQTQQASTSVSQLRIHLSWAEDNLPRLPERGEAFVLDFFKRLDTIYAIIQSFEASAHRPDLSPEQARLETIQQRMIGRSGAFLGKLGGTRRVRQLRPAEVSRESHPWWFIDLEVAEQRIAFLGRLRWGGGIVGAILLILVILFNTVLKPDPALIERIQLVDNATESILTLNDFEAALSQVEVALSTRPQDMELLIFKAVILENLNRADEIDPLLERALALASAPEEVPLLRGRTSFRIGLLELALTYAEEAIALNQDSAEAWLLAGQAYASLNQTGQAFEALQTAADLAFDQGKDTIYTTAKINMAYLAPSIQ